MKEILGIGNVCLWVEGIPEGMSYQKIKEEFERFGKVKKVRTKIDKKSGRFLGSAVIYF